MFIALVDAEIVVAMGPVAWLTHARKTLFTREDTFNIHKMFGFPCLVHFIYRFTQVGPTDMGFGANRFSLACIAMHIMLSSTSLIFKIPTKRIKEGSRIWPEYRLHSINFAFRSIACMLVTMGEKALGREDRPMYALNALIVLAGAAGASAGSASVGTDNRSNSIRDLDGPAWFKFFFSWAQFIATTNCLIGQRRFSLQFVYVFVIQFTAFLMTLRRKNLAPHYPLVATYGAILAFALGVALYETSYFSSVFMVLSLTNLAALGRMGFGINKYVLWVGMAGIVHVARPHFGDDSPYLWPLAFAVSTAATLVNAVRYVQRKNAAAKEPAKKAD